MTRPARCLPGEIYGNSDCAQDASWRILSPVLTVIRFRLREAREARTLTQAQLAERVGVRQATISDLETGKAKVLRLALLAALCAALDTTPADLIEYEAPKRRKG